MRTYVTEIAVRYAETDRMGVAHHSSYLLWFELARTGLLREAGYPYRELEAGGVLFPVVDFGCHFRRGADYDDRLLVEATVTEVRSRVVRFRYRVRRGDELLAEGWTRHLCVTPDNAVRRIPSEVIEAIATYRERAG